MTESALSIVIPTLNAATTLGATLDALGEGRDAGLLREVLVVDGGSDDETCRLAAAQGARVIAKTGGRGPQLSSAGRCYPAPFTSQSSCCGVKLALP